MQLILKQTVENLGEEGDVVKVRPGYGRNYLMPQGMAITASKGNLAQLEIEKVAIEARKKQQREDAESVARKLEACTITIEKRVGDENKLYGSVTSSDLADKLAEQGIVIDRRKIVLDEPIKTLCETSVTVKVGYQVTAQIKVNIIPQAE
ncbi:MAG: 50S ribosomal protein L9 [Proteobacteria bacterium]|nr:50S ribosomal protein L9 [Desulfobulbaceae bacterium]MBU4151510.1 50S ribosomal protein L9 [Pseudomonadota bacterium]